MTVDELGQLVKSKHPEYSSFSDSDVGGKVAAKYPEYRAKLSASTGSTNAETIEPGIYGETSPTGQRLIENAMTAGVGYGVGNLGANVAKFGIGKVGKLVSKFKDIRNAPQALADALESGAGKFGTVETPSMVGNTARTSLDAEQSLNEALAQKLYGQVDKAVPVSTPRLSSTYQELADELQPGLGNAVKKHIQLEPNPIKPGDVGEYRGVTTKAPDITIKGKTTVKTNIPKRNPAEPITRGSQERYYTVNKRPDTVIPGKTEYGVGYSASPGTPTQLPSNTSPVGDLIKLRSKLGAASRSGGIDGYNAGKLKAALDEDIANIGMGEGPLGKMTNDVTAEPLKRATNYYREVMQQQNTPLYKKLATGKVEDIPDIIFKNGRTVDINEARAALGEEGFHAAKKSFFNDLINSKDVGKALGKYSKNNSDFLQTVFNEGELSSLKTVADLQQKAVQAEKTVERAKMLMTGAAAAAVGGGIAGKTAKFVMDSK